MPETDAEDRGLSEAAKSLLREAARRFGTQDELAAASGVPKPTIQRILGGSGDPGISKVARLAAAMNLSLDDLLRQNGADDDAPGPASAVRRDLPVPTKALRNISLTNVSASAGNGSYVLDEAPAEMVPFPVTWLRTLGNPAHLRLLRVSGDSMEPDLRDGDLIMIDRDKTWLREGLFVVVLSDQLLAKRIRLLANGLVELVSSNPAYPPIQVNIVTGELHIAGKIVWAGKAY